MSIENNDDLYSGDRLKTRGELTDQQRLRVAKMIHDEYLPTKSEIESRPSRSEYYRYPDEDIDDRYKDCSPGERETIFNNTRGSEYQFLVDGDLKIPVTGRWKRPSDCTRHQRLRLQKILGSSMEKERRAAFVVTSARRSRMDAGSILRKLGVGEIIPAQESPVITFWGRIRERIVRFFLPQHLTVQPVLRTEEKFVLDKKVLAETLHLLWDEREVSETQSLHAPTTPNVLQLEDVEISEEEIIDFDKPHRDAVAAMEKANKHHIKVGYEEES